MSGDETNRLAPVALVYSPRAGSAAGVDPAAALRDAGLDVVDSMSVARMAALDPTRLAARWRTLDVRAVVAAGGDGSAGAVATLASRVDLPVGILPLGTANDIARALAIPESPADAARLIARLLAAGQERAVDAGELLCAADPAQGARGGLFLHALTLGLNVEFARLATDAEQRKRWGKLTYAVSAIESVSHFTPLPVTLRVDGMEGGQAGVADTISAHVALLAVINLPVFGGWMELRVPDVRDDDRLLDFIVIEAPTAPGMAALAVALEAALTALARGAGGARRPPVKALPGARWFRARSVEIATPAPAQITLDGELRGVTPATVRVAERPARMLAPLPRLTPRATLKRKPREPATGSDNERRSGTKI